MFPSIRGIVSRVFRRRKDGEVARPPVLPRVATVAREDIESLVGMPVGDLDLYRQALLHRSVLRGQPESYLLSNERLEFLGDAVLGFVIAEHLYLQFPDRDEGFLTRLRAKLVNGQALASFAKRMGLGAVLLLSENMDQAEGRRNPTILADAFEAVIGALYLDMGEQAARAFIEQKVLALVELDSLARQRDNYKSALLEYVQSHGWPQPEYRVTSEEGPSHDRTFNVEVLINDRPFGEGRAGSKKKAEQVAASEALLRLRVEAPEE